MKINVKQSDCRFIVKPEDRIVICRLDRLNGHPLKRCVSEFARDCTEGSNVTFYLFGSKADSVEMPKSFTGIARCSVDDEWDEEKGNVDTPNSAKNVKAALLSIEGLTAEQRIAIYQSYRGKRNGFGWYDWDGVSGGSGYRRYRRRGYRRRGRKGRSYTAPAIKQSAFKAKSSSSTYKDIAKTLPTASASRSSANYNTGSIKSKVASASKPKTSRRTSAVKIEPPKVKFKKYEV